MKRISLLLFFFLLPSLAYAVGEIRVSPAKLEVIADPGEQLTPTISLDNLSDEASTVILTLESVDPTETGVETLGGVGADDPSYSFVSIPQQKFTLAPNSRTNASLRIAPTKETPPGSHALALIITQIRAPEEGKETRVISRVAVLVIITVTGELHPSAALSGFNTSDQRRLYTTQVVPLSIRFKNRGNGYLNPYGIVSVHSLFGRLLSRHQIDPWYVLPNSERSREFRITLPYVGIYRVTLEQNRGYQDIIDTSAISLIYLPRWLVVLTLLALAGAVFAMIKRSRA